MDLNRYYNFEELTNEAERLVIKELGRQLEQAHSSVADNEELVLDIAAYALNHVPPMYRVNLMGRIYANTFGDQHGEEIREAVRRAIEKIMASDLSSSSNQTT
jgi:competence protein ComFB